MGSGTEATSKRTWGGWEGQPGVSAQVKSRQRQAVQMAHAHAEGWKNAQGRPRPQGGPAVSGSQEARVRAPCLLPPCCPHLGQRPQERGSGPAAGPH